MNEKLLRMRVAKKCFSIYQLPTHQILASFFEKLTACLSKERQSYEDFIILSDFHIDVKVAGRESPNGIAVWLPNQRMFFNIRVYVFQYQSLKGKYLCSPLKYCRHIVISGSARPCSWIGDLN